MKTNKLNQSNSGFTLVELAIVIVIIGLLVGGVLQGQELIKQAQIRSAMSTIQGYNAAINTFRAKYNEMPGDISRAGMFGLNTAKGTITPINICSTAAALATATTGADGNGDGALSATGTTACGAAGASTAVLATAVAASTNSGEIANFWVHLGNSQLVKGSYSHVTASNVVGTSYPSMPVGTGIMALTSNGLTNWVLGVPGTVALLSDISMTGTLSPSEAFGLDSKLDDGSPTTGTMMAVQAYTGAFAAVATVSNAVCAFTTTTYNIAALPDTKNCLLAMRADG